ncbi:MAG TPA: helix-turn-helix transcriptional regulator [Gemmataceae bacterium]|nr:helix-turn-helix transcriptional regulator [Gemmataceae bacterium]
MENTLAERVGANLRQTRLKARLTQQVLAKRSGINRTSLVKIELGQYALSIDEVTRLAGALRVPVQQFLTGKTRPSADLRGIAFELYHLGVRDYLVEEAAVPGAFRPPEEVVVLALRGDRPETRLIDAMPFVLATHPLNQGLALAFANIHDRRVRVRLAWLSEVTLALARNSAFPVAVQKAGGLEGFVKRAKKADEPDSLGHPASARTGPLWRRWNITYGGTMDDFLQRARALAHAHPPGDEE